MVSKADILSGTIRGAAAIGSLIRLTYWVKGSPGRTLRLHLHYEDETPVWELELQDNNQDIHINEQANTLELVLAEVTLKIGART